MNRHSIGVCVCFAAMKVLAAGYWVESLGLFGLTAMVAAMAQAMDEIKGPPA